MEDIRKHQLKELEMLLILKKILYKENIKFFLIGGTALGSVRHKGFIPWDDDIDIGVYRKDFKRLEKILIEKLEKTEMIYYKAGNNKKPDPIGRLYLREEIKNNTITKIIDIHPIDNVPQSYISQIFQYISLPFYYLFLHNRPARSKGKIIYTITKIILILIPLKIRFFLKEFLEKYIKSFKEKDKVVNLHGVKGYWKEIMPREYIGSLVLKEFEGEMFYIPEKWHEYLTFLYGDYMKLPDEEDRKPRHGLKESEEEK